MPLLASAIDERLDVTQYRPDKDGVGGLRLTNGTLLVTMPYTFYNDDGAQIEGTINVKLEATPEQLTSIKQALATMMAATNAVFETENNWTRFVEEPEPE